MKIVHADEVEWKRGLQHRGGTFHYRHLLNGMPGTIGNFQFNVGQQDGDFASPRHRHNFDQFRFQIEGGMNFDRNGKMTAGTLGYFPEGAAYGPQTSDGRSTTAVLQFGGASGSGYLSPAEVSATTEELKKFGTFEGGIFRRNDDVEGRRNSDAYQAIWEHANQRPMIYPKPRYSRPFMMDPGHYEWLSADEAGVTEKLMGVFTERRSTARFLRLEPGATHRGTGRSLYFVIEGEGTVESEPLQRLTTTYLQRGEHATFTARARTSMLHLGMPDLTGISAQGSDVTAVAAE